MGKLFHWTSVQLDTFSGNVSSSCVFQSTKLFKETKPKIQLNNQTNTNLRTYVRISSLGRSVKSSPHWPCRWLLTLWRLSLYSDSADWPNAMLITLFLPKKNLQNNWLESKLMTSKNNTCLIWVVCVVLSVWNSSCFQCETRISGHIYRHMIGPRGKRTLVPIRVPESGLPVWAASPCWLFLSFSLQSKPLERKSLRIVPLLRGGSFVIHSPLIFRFDLAMSARREELENKQWKQ